AHTIQLAVAPVFMLAGIGSFLNVLTGRLNRVVDRARLLAEQQRSRVGDPAPRLVELRHLDRRIRLASIAIWLCTASALMICFVVAGLFIAGLARLGFARTMAVGFVLAMLLLVAGLLVFLVEVRVAYRAIRISDDLLERKLKR
ncbi:DUF2721 domain-containing protein, partial [Sphingomonas solaris]